MAYSGTCYEMDIPTSGFDSGTPNFYSLFIEYTNYSGGTLNQIYSAYDDHGGFPGGIQLKICALSAPTIYYNNVSYNNEWTTELCAGCCNDNIECISTTTTTTGVPTTTTTSTTFTPTNFKKKYYFTFKSNQDIQYTVELWQNTGTTITAQEIIGYDEPFKVTYPVTSKFDAVRGSGCDINILSTTNMKFIDLYTVDIQEYLIKLYTANDTANDLWLGYLNADLYSEPFDELNNYPVALTGNDGLGLLEKFDYYQSDATKYTGFTNNWSIIKNILTKINLPWNAIYVGLSTTSSEVTINETILNSTYSMNENYYDEDGMPMNCRKVIETILQPFGAYIQIINGYLYITDNNILASNSSYTFSKYNSSTFVYEGSELINLNIGDLSTIGFASDSQNLNIIPIINKQKVIFSPYQTKTLIDYKTDDDIYSGNTTIHTFTSFNIIDYANSYSNFWTKYNPTNVDVGSSYFADVTTMSEFNDEKYKCLVVGKNFTPDTYPDLFTYTGSIPPFVITPNIYSVYNFRGEWDVNTEGDIWFYSYNDVVTYNSNYYLCTEFHYPQASPIANPPPNDYFTGTTSSILDPITDKFYYLKVEAKAYVRAYESSNVGICNLLSKLIIGNKKYDRTTGTWVDIGEETFLNLIFYNFTQDVENNTGTYSNISNTWVDTSWHVPLYGFTGTTVDFRISEYKIFNVNYDEISNFEDVRLKDIKFTIVDQHFKETNLADFEYYSYINKNINYNGSDITLNLGCNTEEYPLTKGAILGYDNNFYYFIKSFTRAGETDTLENLLAGSIVSNYTPKIVEVQCSNNITNSLFGTLTYNNYLSGKKFTIQGLVIDYHEATIDLTIQEVIADNYDLVKNY